MGELTSLFSSGGGGGGSGYSLDVSPSSDARSAASSSNGNISNSGLTIGGINSSSATIFILAAVGIVGLALLIFRGK